MAGLLALTACPGARKATTTLSGGIMSGKALLPATAKSETVYVGRYKEIGGGNLTRALLLLSSAPVNMDMEVTDNCGGYSSTSNPGGYKKSRRNCRVTKKTTKITTWTTREQIERWAPTARYLMKGTLPTELDIAFYSNGKSSTSDEGAHAGGRFALFFKKPVALYGRGAGMMDLSFGFMIDFLTFRDIEHSRTTMTGPGQLTTTTEVRDFKYRNVGFPVRLSAMVAPFALAYMQYDWNILSMFGDDQNSLYSSPLRAGLQLSAGGFKHLYGNIEAISDGGDPKRLSFLAEVGIAF